MAVEQTDRLKSLMKKVLPDKLYRHSIDTAETAAEMADAFGVDREKAYRTGLLHDCAKAFPNEELLKKAEELGIEITDVDREEPYLLHSPVGAELAREEYGEKDPEVLQAIERHTVGAPDMTALDKIAYVADIIEPGRHYPGLDGIRELAKKDLDECYMEAYSHTLEYLLRTGKPIHPLSVAAWNSIVRRSR